MLKKIFTKTSDYTGYSYDYLLKQRHKIAVSVITGCLMLGIVTAFALGGVPSKEVTTGSQIAQTQSFVTHDGNKFNTETVAVATNLLEKKSDSILTQTAEQNKQSRLDAEAKAKALEEAKKKEEAQKLQEAQEKARQTVALSRGGSYSTNASDVELLERVVMAEAGAEPYDGQVAVANVVLNRIRSGRYPNSVRAVVSQSGQFTSYANGSISRVHPTTSVKNAVRDALNGKQAVPSSTMYFLNKSTATDLSIPRTQTFVAKIGNHSFYR